MNPALPIKFKPTSLTLHQALHYPRLVGASLEIPVVIATHKLFIIGRDEKLSHLVIDDEFISRTHAAIMREGQSFFIKDLHSKNGTFLNGKKMKTGEQRAQALRSGDKVSFNIVEFEFILPDGASPEPGG